MDLTRPSASSSEDPTANNIKAFFFEELFLELESKGYGSNWMSFPGGGNIKTPKSIIQFFCNDFTVRSSYKMWYENIWVTTSVAAFDLRDPECRQKMMEWIGDVTER